MPVMIMRSTKAVSKTVQGLWTNMFVILISSLILSMAYFSPDSVLK